MGVPIGTALIIGQLALGAVSTFAQIGQARAAAAESSQIAAENFTAANKELTRQQERVQEVASERRAERIARADRELGTLRVVLGELGAGRANTISLVSELGFIEGIDLTRIGRNADDEVESIQSRKEAAHRETTDTISAARRSFSNARTGAILGLVGTGLKVGAGEFRRREELDVLRNKRKD